MMKVETDLTGSVDRLSQAAIHGGESSVAHLQVRRMRFTSPGTPAPFD
jgi:hypothetical protein